VDQQASRGPSILFGATIYPSRLKGSQGETPFPKVTASIHRRSLARGFLLWQAPTGPVDSLINQPILLASTKSGNQGSLMLFY